MWCDVEGVSIELNPNPGGAFDTEGTVLVGLGDPNLAFTQHAVVLNHKGFNNKNVQGPFFHSVSHFVAEIGAEQWDEWERRLPSLAKIKKIIVEDFSLDTCFALYLFAAMLNKSLREEARKNNKTWVEYVTAWECGHYVDGSALQKSAACLHTVLAHSYVPDGAESVRDDATKEGLTRCLKHLSDMVAHHPSPTEGIGVMNTVEYTRALCNLDYEKQLYQFALQQGNRCQLLVNLKGTSRNVLTDVLILSEIEPSGILKILARTDHENSWSKRGFGLLAIHRPSELGSGNDMTISVDPATGITLKQFWSKLEKMEDERWGDERPRNAPRHLLSYMDAHGNLLPGAPNQPWYDENGKFTLIGAPKQIKPGLPGSKLDWQNDVIPSLWHQYLGQYLAQWVVVDKSTYQHEKTIKVMRWQDTPTNLGLFNPEKGIQETPTFHAWLASHSSNNGAATSSLNLPPQNSFETLRLGKVLTVVHRDGVTFFLPESGAGCPENFCEISFQVAAGSAAFTKFLNDNAENLKQWLKSLIESGDSASGKPPRLTTWSKSIQKTKAQALAAMGDIATLGGGYHEHLLSEALQKLWGISEQRTQVMELIDRLDELMRQSIMAKSDRRQRIYGSIFSALGLGFILKETWEPIKNKLSMNSYEWQMKMFHKMFHENPTHIQNTLQETANQISLYETLSIAFIVSGFLIGLLLYWIFGIRGEK